MATGTLEEGAFDDAFEAAAAEPPRFGPADMAAVYEAHFQFVWRCLRSLGVRDDVLDDALQDVFVVVQNKLRHFDGKASLRTWLYGITLRVARRYRARIAKDAQKFVGSMPPGADATSSGEEAGAEEWGNLVAPRGDLERDLDTSERLKLARRALDQLDDEKREAFVLACVEQMSAPEIVQITGLPLNTVYSRIRAARLAFAAEVARLQSLSRRSAP